MSIDMTLKVKVAIDIFCGGIVVRRFWIPNPLFRDYFHIGFPRNQGDKVVLGVKVSKRTVK